MVFSPDNWSPAERSHSAVFQPDTDTTGNWSPQIGYQVQVVIRTLPFGQLKLTVKRVITTAFPENKAAIKPLFCGEIRLIYSGVGEGVGQVELGLLGGIEC